MKKLITIIIFGASCKWMEWEDGRELFTDEIAAIKYKIKSND
jgi:hypothetical protein